MDNTEALALRADVAAEAHLAETLQKAYAHSTVRLDDPQIDVLRQTFVLGWLTGFHAATVDMAGELKGLVDDD